MKQSIYFFSIVFMVGFLMSSCGTSDADKEKDRKIRKLSENPIEWNNYSVTQNVPFDKDTLHVSYVVDIEYRYPQEYSNESIKEKLTNILNTELWGELKPDLEGNYPAANLYVDNYINDLKGAYLEQLNELIPLWNGRNGDSLFTETQKISTEVVFNKANFVSYQVVNQMRRGNNDSIPYDYTVTNLVLDVVEAKRLKESDIFKSDYKEELNKRIVAKMLDELKVDNEEQLKASDYWGVYDMAANNNFVVTADNICYTFNPQEYAEKKEGIINICFTYDELKDLFAQNSPLNFFIDNVDTTK